MNEDMTCETGKCGREILTGIIKSYMIVNFN